MKEKKPVPKRAIAAVALAVVLVGGGVFAGVLISGRQAQEQPEPVATQSVGGRGIVATEDNIEEINARMNESVRGGYYRTRMNVDWTFETWDTPSKDAYVENATSNTYTVYFDLLLPDTEELIYSSPYIPVGAKLENFALDAELPAGDYKATVVYHLVEDDYSELSTVSVKVNLQILG